MKTKQYIKALGTANEYFMAGQYTEALREYSDVLRNNPLSKEAYNGAILCDMAMSGEAGAEALFDYYAILRAEDTEQADTVISEILETMDGTLDQLTGLFNEGIMQRVEFADGIMYSEFKELVVDENDFKRIFENIMFSTRVIITEKEDFVDFLDNLIDNGYREMALSYLESALGVYPNDTQLRNLLRRLAKEMILKIEIQGQPFRYISENSMDCDSSCAFMLTKQNEKFKDDAIRRGAPTLLSPSECWELFGLNRITVIGITGTNGKTTTASAIYSILLDLGHKCAMQGTRGFFMNDESAGGKTLTTPTVLNTYRHMLQAIQSGCEYFVMEVSSHAIEQERIAGINFGLKILTNITQDHLDYHESIEEYVRIKNLFFADESKKLINKDEPKAQFNFKNAFTYGVENPATYKILAYSLNDGVSGILKYFEEHVTFATSLHGFFNLYNMTAAMAAVHLVSGESLEKIADVIENFGGVSGRMEVVSESPLVIVDFAHTPDGMEQVLNALKEKEVLVVFGAGGDRDRTKRPMMGRVASMYAKKVYVTSDNPRYEDPDMIIEEILSGIDDKSKVFVDVNRRSAIERALRERSGDEVVLILGKGDETSQIIYDQSLPFDDRVVAREILAQL